MSFKRVIVVGPTRSICVNLHNTITLDSPPETLLQRECGDELTDAIATLPQGGFGVVAGTGVGKSVGIRRICQETLGKTGLKVGIVTQEHRTNKETWQCDVLVATPGVVLHWAKNGKIAKDDLIVLDEIHQSSSQLELSMGLLKSLGCTFVWMSATIDPVIFQDYFGTRQLITCDTYDERRRASIDLQNLPVKGFLDFNVPSFASGKRGVVVFVPTRNEAEQLAKQYDGQHGVHASFYHGGEPAEKLRAYMDGSIPRPYIVFMTPVGASSLNISKLDTVVIVDEMFTEVVTGGRRQMVKMNLDTNTLLQMIGRVDGRAIGGQVYILSYRALKPRELKPETPKFTLGGDLELLAMTSAHLGIDVSTLPLIGPYDTLAYKETFGRLVQRGIISVKDNIPTLTQLGQRIEPLPVGVPWGEVIVKAQDVGNEELLRVVCLTACTGELYKLTGRNWVADNDSFTVWNSEHLTCYNIVTAALQYFGQMDERGYRVGGKTFRDWCKDKHYSQKEIQNIVLLLGSLYRQLGIEMPEPASLKPIKQDSTLHLMFIELLAATQSMHYVRFKEHQGRMVFGNDKYGVTEGDSVLGSIRYWTAPSGASCATIEGTHIPFEVTTRYGDVKEVEVLKIAENLCEVSAVVTFAGEVFVTRRLVLPINQVPDAALHEYRSRQRREAERLRTLREREAKLDTRVTQLTETACTLRDEADQLVTQNGEFFSEELLYELAGLVVDDTYLPYTADGLNSWIESAEAIVAQARSASNHGVEPGEGVSSEALAQLAAHFRSR